MTIHGLTINPETLAAFCRKHQIQKLALFGSVLREDFGPESDVDILVEFTPEARVGLITLAGIEEDLSRLLDRKVDLNTLGFLSPYFRDEVRRQAEVLYDAA